MEYKRIVSVTGLSGLFELVSSKSDGGLVRSLEDKSTKYVSNRIHSFSQLESIEVFTTKDNVNLIEVFGAMKASKIALPSDKDTVAIKQYFEKVFPAMDFDRVYASDMKKMIKWYKLLTENKVDIKLSETVEEETQLIETPTAKAKPSATTKTATSKNAPAKKINTPRKMA